MSEPLAFTAFIELLGVRLTLGQRVLSRVAFDGLEPCDLPELERDVARQLFGPVETISPIARAVFTLVAGARGGKTYLDTLRLLHLALTVELAPLAPGEHAFGVIVAPDLRLARQALRFAKGALASSPGLVAASASDSITVRRPDGAPVTLECLPATRGGGALRGRSLVGALLDEAAFFRDESFVVNDLEIFKAVAARIVPGGQLIIDSTPWAETGVLYQLWRDNHPANGTDRPHRTAMVAWAPTLLLRDDAHTAAMVERERERDPDNARREFDAEFMSAGSGLFFEPATIDDAIDRELAQPLPHVPGAVVGAGGDFAFRSDSSALVVTQREQDKYTVSRIEERRPQRGQPLLPSAVVADFAELVAGYGARAMVSDGHYRQAIAEHLATARLDLVDAPPGQPGKVEVFTLARSLLRERRVKLPNHPRLVAQLREVVARPTSGGGLQISSPRWQKGGHGDLASAFVLSLWQAHRSGLAWVEDGDDRNRRQSIQFNTGGF